MKSKETDAVAGSNFNPPACDREKNRNKSGETNVRRKASEEKAGQLACIQRLARMGGLSDAAS